MHFSILCQKTQDYVQQNPRLGRADRANFEHPRHPCALPCRGNVPSEPYITLVRGACHTMQFDGASSSSEGPPAFKDGEPAEHQSAPMSRHTQFLSATNEPLHLYVGADQQNKSNHSPGQDTGESSGDGGRVVTRSKRTGNCTRWPPLDSFPRTAL